MISLCHACCKFCLENRWTRGSQNSSLFVWFCLREIIAWTDFIATALFSQKNTVVKSFFLFMFSSLVLVIYFQFVSFSAGWEAFGEMSEIFLLFIFLLKRIRSQCEQYSVTGFMPGPLRNMQLLKLLTPAPSLLSYFTFSNQSLIRPSCRWTEYLCILILI